MDGARFDAIAKAWTTASRRGVLQHVVGALGAAGVAALGHRSGLAAPTECGVTCSLLGLRGNALAACKQVCRRDCGGDPNRLCPTGTTIPTGFICCDSGESCFPGLGCCPSGSAVCNEGTAGAFCCPGGECCIDLATGNEARGAGDPNGACI
jgi:hypothetical protein